MFPQTMLTDRLAAQRYNVSVRTLLRWDTIPALQFPPPVRINGRRYREVAALDRWDKENSRKAAAKSATPRTGRPPKAAAAAREAR